MGPGSTGHSIGAYQTNLWWPFLYLKSDSPLVFGTLMQNWICLLWWATSLQQGLQTIHEESALELQIKDGRKLTHNHNGLTKTWEHPWVSQKTNALPSPRGSNYTIGQSHKSLQWKHSWGSWTGTLHPLTGSNHNGPVWLYHENIHEWATKSVKWNFVLTFHFI